jgi:outer membrane protein assembly factor BamB
MDGGRSPANGYITGWTGVRAVVLSVFLGERGTSPGPISSIVRGGRRGGSEILKRTSFCSLVVALTAAIVSLPIPLGASSSGDWPGYMYDRNHTGFDRAETTISPSSAPNLHTEWSIDAGDKVFAEPVTANGLLYWGSFDGVEHASDPSTGSVVWHQSLGTTSDTVHCSSLVAGVVSTPLVATIMLNGSPRSVLFVGGGDAAMYALDALTGAVLWRTSLGTSPSHFIWDSPVIYKGSVYIGVSSFLDCPIVPGRVFKLGAMTGHIKATFEVAPEGCTGGGVWGSPVVDFSQGTLYFATGNPNENKPCPVPFDLAPAVVEVRASDLSLVDAWRVPDAEQIVDSDFGSTPNLFSANGVPMVGVANKNGTYYAFRRDALGAGPVWQDPVSDGSVPLLSPAAVGYSSLLIASTQTTIHGVVCKGSLRGVDPSTGAYRWQLCLANQVQGAVSMAPGVIVVGVGPRLVLVSASSGKVLSSFIDTHAGSWFKGGSSISNGHIYIGNADGILYAFGV